MPLKRDALAKVKADKPQPKAAPPPEPAPRPAARTTGAFWLTPEDRAIFQQATVLLAGAGIRPSDSLTLRAVLRMALPLDTRFIDQCRELLEQDGRKTRHQKPVA